MFAPKDAYIPAQTETSLPRFAEVVTSKRKRTSPMQPPSQTIDLPASLIRAFALERDKLSKEEVDTVLTSMRDNPAIERQITLVRQRHASDKRSKGVHGDYE